MPVATADAVLDGVLLKVLNGAQVSGDQQCLNVFNNTVGEFDQDGVDHGWWLNGTGSSQTVRLHADFGFGGYTGSAWVLVSATAPTALAPSPVATASAVAGAVQLTIASGASDSGTVVVPNGSYLYVIQIDVSVTWAGSSDWQLRLYNAGGAQQAVVAYWPSANNGATPTVDSWKSPAFITTGTKYPTIARVPSAVNSLPGWCAYSNIYVPNNHYVYVIAADYSITWGGSTDQFVALQDSPGGTLRCFLVAWPSQVSGAFSGSWKSPFFVTGGTNTRPDTKWANDGATINGAARDILNPTQSPIGTSVGHGQGWYQNTSGAGQRLRAQTAFNAGGYGPWNTWVLVSATPPASLVAPGGGGGGGSLARSSAILIG